MSDMTGQFESWHLDKRVPVAIILSIALQTFAAIWWAATVNSRVAAAETNIVKLEAVTDAQRSAAQMQAVQLGRIEEQIGGLRQDIGRMLSVIERGRGQ